MSPGGAQVLKEMSLDGVNGVFLQPSSLMKVSSFTYPATQHYPVPASQQHPPAKGRRTESPRSTSGLTPLLTKHWASLPTTGYLKLRASSGVPAGQLQHQQRKRSGFNMSKSFVKPRGCFQKERKKKGFLVHSCKVFTLMLNDNCLQNSIAKAPQRH